MSAVRSDETPVQLTRKVAVGGVAPLPGQQPVVFAPAGERSHAGCGVDCHAVLISRPPLRFRPRVQACATARPATAGCRGGCSRSRTAATDTGFPAARI